MPKMNPINILAYNGDIKFAHSFPLAVLANGNFQAEIDDPEMLTSIHQLLDAEQKADRNHRVGRERTRKGKNVLVSRERQALVEFLDRFGKFSVQGERTTERFIVYQMSFSASYVVDKRDGSIYPNGYAVPGGQDAYHEHGMWRGDQSPTNPVSTYGIGLGARVWDKVTITTPAGQSTTSWAIVRENGDGPIARLNSFVGIWTDPKSASGDRSGVFNVMSMPPSGDRSTKRIMPYSDEACEFFYRTTMEICRMNEALRGFFGDGPEQLLFNIKSGVPLLAGPDHAEQ